MINFQNHASSSRGNLYTVGDGQTRLILECGLNVKGIKKALKWNVSGHSGLLLSHGHQDHCKGLQGLLAHGMDCFMSQGTADISGVSGRHNVHIVRSGEQFKIGSWTILPFDAVHNCREPLGFLLASSQGGKLLFAVDTGYIKYRFKGLTHIAIEANHSRRELQESVFQGLTPPDVGKAVTMNHMALETVLDMLRVNDSSRLEEVHLLHLSDNHADEQLFKKEVQKIVGVPVYV